MIDSGAEKMGQSMILGIAFSVLLILTTTPASDHLAASGLFAIGNGPAQGKSFDADGSVVDFS